MPTPSTRTPVRIARGSYSNLNGSVSDLQDGEISYAEDQNKLYIKEGSSLVALTYTPASPAFTGTITGVNLTLSGNLTVNGTQTIINTQTLEVEDKQIEIGKVSSPSDTTANGGGIVLKGSSDKSITWLDATDAWTSDQNFEITSGKNLKVDAGTFFVDGGNNKVGIGTTSPASYNANASELVVHDGSGSCGITISTPNNTIGRIAFADPEDDNRGEVRYSHATNAMDFTVNALTALTIASTGAATFAGTVFDSKGDLRKIVKSTKSSAYTLVASDAGKAIYTDSGVTLNNNIFGNGDAVTIINQSGADITITSGSGVTIFNTADATTGNRTLAGRGMATMWFADPSTAYISGAWLS